MSDSRLGAKRSHAASGFTLLELLIVIGASAILLSIAVPAVGRYQSEQGVQSSQNAMIRMSARARSVALERGGAELRVVPAEHAAYVLSGTDTLQTVRFRDEYQTSVSAAAVIRVCYTPRGFAVRECDGANLTTTDKVVRFASSGRADSLRVRGLGQVERF